MHKHLSIFIAVASVASSLVAQNNLSDFLNMGVTFTSRNGANFVEATMYTRIDVESYAGWGFDATQPGMRVFSGLRFDIQDQDLATQDTFRLTAYTELTPPSNTPDTTTPIATTGNFVLPVGTGAGAFLSTANFVTPIAVPATADVFVGVGTTLGWTNPITDGLSIWATSGAVSSALRDEAGFGEPTTSPGNTFSGHYQPVANTHSFIAQRQSHIEPIIATPAGVCSSLHNADPVHANANTSPGTTCMHSALSPDSQSPPRTAGRADDVGMTFRHTGMPDGSLAIFLVDISPTFGTEFPLSLFLPGSVGAMCVNQASVQSVAIGFTSGGSASNVITFSPATRTYIAGVPLIHQVVTIDALTGTAYAGPCSKQTL
ncbi:MAG: hypothetical protein IT456_23285 [Planctomycetes bacterium]|nr:hypothetical protein [Planctomycetota bacterium]